LVWPSTPDQQVAAVAGALIRRKRLWEHRREARALPVGIAACERDDVLVAELLERFRGEERAVARLAVDDDRRGLVRRGGLDLRLQEAADEMDGAGDVALVPLVLLAHVDEERVALELARAGDVDFVDVGAQLCEEIPVTRHDFHKYSDGTADYAGRR
jgi:hypothetical protein